MSEQTAPVRKKRHVRFSIKLKFSLAMIMLTVVVVLFITRYFTNDEIEIMKRATFSYAERESDHLSDIATDALSTQNELQLANAVDNMKSSGSMNVAVNYIHVLDETGTVIKSTDPAIAGKIMDDEISKKAMAFTDQKKNLMQTIPDPNDPKGVVYDFSTPIFHSIRTEERLATVRLGFSDKPIRDQVSKIQEVSLIISLVFIGISIVVAYMIAWFTTRPLKQLSRGVQIIGTGELDHKIKVSSHDEIGLLADEFNLMTTELKGARNKDIENALMAEQLEVAKEIQEGLNPMGFYDKRGIQVKGYTRAAKGVGGDYFDYIDIDDNRVGILISDVAGKGIPASLVMVMIRTVFVSAVHQDSSKIHCKKVVSAINRSLSADFAIDKFATLLFLIYDRLTGKLSFSNAGHGPVFCYRADKKICTVTKLDGVPIGITDDAEYLQGEIPFKKGDIVVMYTDGITEMRNPEKEEYGRNRLQKLVIENCQLNAKELTDLIVKDVDEFRREANPHDDMTVVVIKRVS